MVAKPSTWTWNYISCRTCVHFVQTSSSLNFGQKISSLTRYRFSRLNLVRIATILSGMKSLNHSVRFLFVQDTIMTCHWQWMYPYFWQLHDSRACWQHLTYGVAWQSMLCILLYLMVFMFSCNLSHLVLTCKYFDFVPGSWVAGICWEPRLRSAWRACAQGMLGLPLPRWCSWTSRGMCPVTLFIKLLGLFYCCVPITTNGDPCSS